MTKLQDRVYKIIDRHFTDMMSPDIRRLLNMSNLDLYYGPITEPDDGAPWPGFIKATEQLSNWADENLCEVWYDIQSGEILFSEPTGYYDEDDVDNETGGPLWIEPCWEDYTHLELPDVKRAVFGRELAHHI